MRFNVFFVFLVVLTFSGGGVFGQEAKEGGGDLRAAVQNPVGAMYSLPLKLTVDSGAPNGSAYFFNVNPVIPVTIGD